MGRKMREKKRTKEKNLGNDGEEQRIQLPIKIKKVPKLKHTIATTTKNDT